MVAASDRSSRLFRTAATLLLMAASGLAGYAYRSYEVETTVPDGILRVEGRVQAARGAIRSNIDGRLAEVLVSVGDSVSVGQVVARIDGRVLQAKLQAARVQLAMERQERAVVAADIARLESEKILAGAQFELTELHVRAGRVDPEALERERRRMQEAEAAAEAARERLVGIDARVESLEAETGGLEAAAGRIEIISQQPGTVTGLPIAPGALVETGDVVLELQDTGRLFLPLPDRLAGPDTSLAGSAARVLLGREGGQTVDAIVGAAPTESGEPGRLSLLLMLDGRTVTTSEGPAVGFIRLDSAARWPPAVR